MRGTNFLLAAMALSALVLIGVTSVGSTTATFTATTSNPGNTFATATLVISNDKPNAGDLVNITNLVPGDTAQRVVHVTNGGNTGFTYAAAGSDYLTFVFSLPSTAGNTFQGLTQDFTVTYTATQLAGAAR